MKLFVFAVYDSASGIYDRPMVARSEGEMLRAFSDLAQNADHPVGAHPEHYQLFSIGVYNDGTAELEQKEVRCVARAHELVAKAKSPAPGSLLEFEKEKVNAS
jgi:hypothetical protein